MTALANSLQLASSKGDIASVSLILQSSVSDPSLHGPSLRDLESALDYAVLYGHVDVVRLLLQHGVPITRPTALVATREDHPNALAIFETFVGYGWDINSAMSERDPEVLPMK